MLAHKRANRVEGRFRAAILGLPHILSIGRNIPLEARKYLSGFCVILLGPGLESVSEAWDNLRDKLGAMV
jgi:hypothetical protein